MGQPRTRLTDQGPIAHPAFPRPVVQTNDVRLWLCRRLRLAKQTQDGIAAAAHGKPRLQGLPLPDPLR
jgi:hypothetical protein